MKSEQEALDETVLAQYGGLDTDDIQTLVVDDKWQATLEQQVEAEIERVTQQLANRVKELEERYEEPLPAVAKEVEVLSANVEKHLKAMGLEW